MHDLQRPPASKKEETLPFRPVMQNISARSPYLLKLLEVAAAALRSRHCGAFPLLDPQRWASTPAPPPPLKRSRDDEKRRKKNTGSAEITSRGFSPPEPWSALHPKEMKAHERNVFLRSVNAWVNIPFIHLFIYFL